MKIVRWPSVVLILAALTTALSGRADELQSADAVLQFALAKTGEYNSFTADFTQSMSTLGVQMEATGVIQFKKPAQIRIDMAVPMMGHEQHSLMVMGPDKVMWQVSSMGGATNIMKVDFKTVPTNNPASAILKNPLETADPRKQLLEAKDKYDFVLLPSVEQEGQAMYVLLGKPKPDASHNSEKSVFLNALGQEKICIGQQDGFPHQLAQLDKSGSNTLMEIAFKNLKLNAPLADDLFVFNPPADANVIDMTQMLLQKMNLTTSAYTNNIVNLSPHSPGIEAPPPTTFPPDGK